MSVAANSLPLVQCSSRTPGNPQFDQNDLDLYYIFALKFFIWKIRSMILIWKIDAEEDNSVATVVTVVSNSVGLSGQTVQNWKGINKVVIKFVSIFIFDTIRLLIARQTNFAGSSLWQVWMIFMRRGSCSQLSERQKWANQIGDAARLQVCSYIDCQAPNKARQQETPTVLERRLCFDALLAFWQ